MTLYPFGRRTLYILYPYRSLSSHCEFRSEILRQLMEYLVPSEVGQFKVMRDRTGLEPPISNLLRLQTLSSPRGLFLVLCVEIHLMSPPLPRKWLSGPVTRKTTSGCETWRSLRFPQITSENKIGPIFRSLLYWWTIFGFPLYTVNYMHQFRFSS